MANFGAKAEVADISTSVRVYRGSVIRVNVYIRNTGDTARTFFVGASIIGEGESVWKNLPGWGTTSTINPNETSSFGFSDYTIPSNAYLGYHGICVKVWADFSKSVLLTERWFPQVVSVAEKPVGYVILSFDFESDSEGDEGTGYVSALTLGAMINITNLLYENDLSATIFAQGACFDNSFSGDQFKDIITTAFFKGCEIGSHSYSHPHNIGNLSRFTVDYELSQTEARLLDAVGEKPIGFRAPYFEWEPGDELWSFLWLRGYLYDSSKWFNDKDHPQSDSSPYQLLDNLYEIPLREADRTKKDMWKEPLSYWTDFVDQATTGKIVLLDFHPQFVKDNWHKFQQVINYTRDLRSQEKIQVVSLSQLAKGSIDDLSLISADPVQVIYGASALVSGKSTLIRAEISNTFNEDKTFIIETAFSGQTFHDSISVPASTTKVVYLPSDNPIKPSPGEHSFLMTIDSDDVIVEINEANNEYGPVDVIAKATADLSISYVPVAVQGIDPGGPPTADEIRQMVSAATTFLYGTYPVEDDGVLLGGASGIGSPQYKYSIAAFLGREDLTAVEIIIDLSAMAFLSAPLNPYNRVVGVVERGWFGRHDIGGIGLSLGELFRGILIENGYYTGVAHEIGHTFGLALTPDREEYERIDGWGVDIKSASGYWVTGPEDARDRTDTHCFMGTAPSESFEGKWVCSDCYEHLLTKFKLSLLDPEVLFVTGFIFRNGTAQLGTWYRLPNGFPDLVPGMVGDHYIVYLDGEGKTLEEIGFNVTFTGQLEQFNVSGFAFSIPYLAGTKTIRLVQNGSTIGERVFTNNSPTVTITFPNGGEILGEDDSFVITWEAADPDYDTLTYTILYSPDGGTNWLPLATGLNEASHLVAVRHLSPSNKYLVRVIASDGVNTGDDVSDSTFTVLTKLRNEVNVEDQTSFVDTVSNSTVSDFIFSVDEKQISFKVTGENDTVGFCNLTIPNTLLWGDFWVYLDGLLLTRDADYTQSYNGTHHLFHVVYSHSTRVIKITGTDVVPEFPSSLVLPLFITATLLVVLLHRRKTLGTAKLREYT